MRLGLGLGRRLGRRLGVGDRRLPSWTDWTWVRVRLGLGAFFISPSIPDFGKASSATMLITTKNSENSSCLSCPSDAWGWVRVQQGMMNYTHIWSYDTFRRLG